MLTSDHKKYIEKSVLCWLATADKDGFPNVSPKEMFVHNNDDKILIAHIASPVSVSNLLANPQVCVSVLDVFVQKGFKIKGLARLIQKNEIDFAPNLKLLTDFYGDFTSSFPVKALIEVSIQSIDSIQAPSYWLFKDRTEAGQIASAMQAYGVREL
jgi:uncharacterized protein